MNAAVLTWRQRLGLGDAYPLHAPTDVERAMVAEIAELRAQADAGPLVVAVRRLAKAKGRYHTEQNYGALVAALDAYDNAGRDPGAEIGLRHRETRMDTGSEPGAGEVARQRDADQDDHRIALARNSAFNEARALLPSVAKEHFNRADASEEFLNGLAYGACAYVAAIKKLQEQQS